MVQRLRKLSEQSQLALKFAACLGLHFELALLARVCGVGPEVARGWLGAAWQAGLLQPVPAGAEAAAVQAFQFVDRTVQQAAYALPLDVNLPELHLRIGRVLWQQTALPDLETRLFAIVDQFNLALNQLSDAAEKLAVAGLNLRAGLLARTAGAPGTAANYFRHGLALLPQDEEAACLGLQRELRSHLSKCQETCRQPDAAVPEAGPAPDAGDSPARLRAQRDALQIRLDENLRLMQRQQQELRQARAEADAALRGRADFLASMGHEIRTPMNAIIGLSHLALKYEADARQRNYRNQIRQSGQHLLVVLNDMLDYARAAAGQLDMEIHPFALDTVFETLAGLCTGMAHSQDVELIWHIAPEVPRTLIGDPLRLGQILLHYTGNAFKCTGQGEVAIAVSVVAREADAVTLRFDVRDTGAGLSEAQIEALYSGFGELQGSTVRRQGSGGIGLAISRRLVGLMGGEVGVHSSPGSGATFWFTARLGLDSSAPARRLSDGLQHKRVLVVDDNANAAAVLCEQLLRLGCVAHGMVCGRAALDELQRAARAGTPYDALLTDWQMPGMDGLELVQQVQATDLGVPPRLVLVSTRGIACTGPQAARYGVTHWLQKPVSESLLYETMVDLFGLSECLAPSAAPAPEQPARNLLDPVRGARILVVENDTLNQQVLQELLESEGFVVALAENGQQALFRIDQCMRGQSPYDVVLMDLHMPVLDGLSTVRLLRSMPQYQQLPVLAMAANAQQSELQLCLRCGMDDVVSKPIEPQTLWQALTRLIRPRAGLPQA